MCHRKISTQMNKTEKLRVLPLEQTEGVKNFIRQPSALQPMVGRFLSADPYIQAPDNPQNLNRYSYCLNNPLRYSDPSGEFLIEAMIIGGLMNWMMNGCEFNLDGAASFGIGALAGASGFGAGYAMAGVAGTIGFAGGAVTGAVGGFAGGFVGGAGNAWTNGANFGQGLAHGLIGGALGALAGGVIGGLQGGVNAKELGLDYWTGKGVGTTVDVSATNPLPIDQGEPTGITNSKQLLEYTFSNYEGSDNYVQGVYYGNDIKSNPFTNNYGYTVEDGQLYNALCEPVHGSTIPIKESLFGDVYSSIIVSPNMVSLSNNLHAVLGHEIIHAFHYYTGFMSFYGPEVSEYYAYSFSASVPHITQSGAAAVAQSLFVGYPFSHYLVYPPWVPLF
jgi:hypothetical protein